MKILTDLSLLMRRGLPLRWLPHDTHHFRVLPANNAPMVCDYLVQAELLAAEHEALPDALHALLLMRERQYGQAVVSNQQVLYTVDLYTKHKVTCEGPNNELYSVHNISGIKVDPSSNLVLIKGDVHQEHLAVHKGRIVSFAAENEKALLPVSVAALEKRYPGWERRWQIGSDMGLEKEELSQTVFTSTPALVQSADINQLDFD